MDISNDVLDALTTANISTERVHSVHVLTEDGGHRITQVSIMHPECIETATGLPYRQTYIVVSDKHENLPGPSRILPIGQLVHLCANVLRCELEMISTRTPEFVAGFEAFQAKSDANPFSSETRESRQWWRGWDYGYLLHKLDKHAFRGW